MQIVTDVISGWEWIDEYFLFRIKTRCKNVKSIYDEVRLDTL